MNDFVRVKRFVDKLRWMAAMLCERKIVFFILTLAIFTNFAVNDDQRVA